jgi:dTDP-4-amino-4,6-dideoxygalactose transaminase
MRTLQGQYPAQGRWRFLSRTARFFVVRLAMTRGPFTALCAACRLLGTNHDELISHSVRGFSGPDFFANIRHQPSAPLLALLLRRLSRFDGDRVARRTVLAEQMTRLAPDASRPGRTAAYHSHWTFPALADAPDELVQHLWNRGFDATRGAWSLYPVPAPAERPDATAPESHEAMGHIVYLPVYPGVRESELAQLARTLSEFAQTRHGPSPAAPCLRSAS